MCHQHSSDASEPLLSMMFPTSAEYRTKSSGPRTEPCGTPYKTDRGVVKLAEYDQISYMMAQQQKLENLIEVESESYPEKYDRIKGYKW